MQATSVFPSLPTSWPRASAFVLLLALGELTSGCTSSTKISQGTGPQKTEHLNQSGAGRSRLEAMADSLAHAHLKAGLTPGLSVAIARGGQLILARGYGQANVEAGVAAKPETVYKIGSITKQYTAALIMRLVESGKMALEDPITKFLPDYPTQGHLVTIRHLLTHTSGIKSFRVLSEENRQRFRMDLTYSEMVDLFGRQPFEFKPGEKYAYNNFGYYLLGEIIGRVTGMPYERYLEQDLLLPLGLSKTYYCESNRIIPQRAAGYEYEKNSLMNARYLSMKVGPAAGGLGATADDLIRWTSLLHGGKVVSAAALRQMTTPTVLAGGDTIGYGFGLQLGELGPKQQIFHNGGANGFVSTLAYYPEDNLTVAVLINSGKGQPVELAKKLARAALGLQVRDLPLPAENRTHYEGTYTYTSGSRTRELRVFSENGYLHAQLTGGQPFRLRYQGGHQFIPATNDDQSLVFAAPQAGPAPLLTIREGRWESTVARRTS